MALDPATAMIGSALLGGLFGGGGGGGGGEPQIPEWWRRYSQDYGEMLDPIIRQQIEFFGQLDPMRRKMILQAIQGLTPERAQKQLDVIASRMRADAETAGIRNAATLRGQGYGKGVQAGSILDASNRATEQVNQTSATMLSPEAQAQRALQALGVVGQGQHLGALSAIPTLVNGQMYGPQQQQGGGFGDYLMQAFGTVAPYIKWK